MSPIPAEPSVGCPALRQPGAAGGRHDLAVAHRPVRVDLPLLAVERVPHPAPGPPPMFHLGFLMVMGGHVVGLLVPKDVTEMLGVSQHMYHLGATYLGTFAAVMTILGLAGLIYRRVVIKSVRLATTRNDLVMYCFLIVPVLLGSAATVLNQLADAHGYDYRETISPWFRSIFMLRPRAELMADVPLAFKLHIVAGLLLFAIWPFTRLVHAVSPPVGYVTRPLHRLPIPRRGDLHRRTAPRLGPGARPGHRQPGGRRPHALPGGVRTPAPPRGRRGPARPRGAVVLVMSPGIALCEAGSRGLSAGGFVALSSHGASRGGFRCAGLALRKPGSGLCRPRIAPIPTSGPPLPMR